MKTLMMAILALTSFSAFASTDKCQKAAESYALKDSGRGSILTQETRNNGAGSFEVYTSKDEMNSDYEVGTKLSADGKSCKVISHKLVDQQSG